MSKELVLITGGNSGIGAACVAHYLANGHRVLNLDITHTTASTNHNEHQISIDLLEVDTLETTLRQLITTYGLPQIIVNSAGISRMDFFIESRLEDWQSVFNLNVMAVFVINKVISNHLVKENKVGRFVNIASQAGKNAYKAMASYVASKHALIGLTKNAALELAPHQIYVNAVCPGIVETPMKQRERVIGGQLRGMTAQEIYEEDCSQVPLGRTATTEEIVALIAFLNSNQNTYMTGQAVNITGGMTMI